MCRPNAWSNAMPTCAFRAVLVFLLGTTTAAGAEGRAPSIAACTQCHGLHGDSKTESVPRLNGQQEAYLAERLLVFLAPNSPNLHYRLWKAQAGRDVDVFGIARYFARQTANAPLSSGPFAAAGAEIFRHGAPPDIPSCSSCHGQKGEGHEVIPRIAGQHASYLISQLEAFRAVSRKGEPMNRHTWDMTSGQMQAVAAYLSRD